MAYFRCEWISEALDMATSAVVILPETGDLARTPVVYLLHGLSDNCTGWSRYTAVERYARNYGVAVVMPEVQRSFYCDTRSGMKYFTYISQELPKICRRFFGLSADPQYNYVMGLSMGGFGALKSGTPGAPASPAPCGLRHPRCCLRRKQTPSGAEELMQGRKTICSPLWLTARIRPPFSRPAASRTDCTR